MTAISGRKCFALFEKSSRATSWAKTFTGSLIGMEGWYSNRCYLTWKLKATKSNRMFFQLLPSTPRIAETGSGSLPLWIISRRPASGSCCRRLLRWTGRHRALPRRYEATRRRTRRANCQPMCGTTGKSWCRLRLRWTRQLAPRK